MIGFILNGAAAAVNAVIWAETGNSVSLVCMIFSAALALACLIMEVAL